MRSKWKCYPWERTYPLMYEMEKYGYIYIEIVNLGMMHGTAIAYLHVIMELEET